MPPKHDIKSEKEHSRKIRNEAFRKLGMIFIGLLFVVNTIQLVRLGSIVERVDEYNRGVVDEIGGVRQDVLSFGSDLNEIRHFLLLPTKDYSFLKNETAITSQESDEKQATRTESAIYTFLAQVESEESAKKNTEISKQFATSLPGDATFTQGIESVGLKLGKAEESDSAMTYKLQDEKGDGLFALVFLKNTAKVNIQSALGTYPVSAIDGTAIKNEILNYVKEHKQKAVDMKALLVAQKTAMAEFQKNSQVAESLKAKKLSFAANPNETDETIEYQVVNTDQKPLMSVKILKKDGTVTLDEKNFYRTTPELVGPFTQQVQSLDMASELDKMVASRKAELNDIFNQSAFKDLLKTSGLSLNTTSREEYNKVLYDVKDGQGKTVFSFVIELSSGMLKVIRGEEETDIYSFLDVGTKKKP